MCAYTHTLLSLTVLHKISTTPKIYIFSYQNTPTFLCESSSSLQLPRGDREDDEPTETPNVRERTTLDRRQALSCWQPSSPCLSLSLSLSSLSLSSFEALSASGLLQSLFWSLLSISTFNRPLGFCFFCCLTFLVWFEFWFW